MQDNMTILSHCWLEGTNDFQQRIPNPVQYGVAAFTQAIFDPLNGDLWNNFANQLNNTIARTDLDYARWNSPLEIFRLQSIPWGHSVREIAQKWLKAHSQNFTDKDLLDVNPPDYEQWYYSVNYQVKYPWTINRPELLQAMSAPDGATAINDMYIMASETAYNSDAYDIAQTLIDCIAEADTRWSSPLMRHSVPITSDKKDNSLNLLEAIRYFTYLWRWPSMVYNHIDVPVFVKNDELVVFISAAEQAGVEVRAYAELFNMSEAQARMRIIVLPELPIPGARAILCSDNFLHWHDTVFGVYPFFNPSNLNDNFWLHHQAAIAPNPASPCVVLYDGDATKMCTVTMTPEKYTLEAENDSVELGGKVGLIGRLEGTVTANDDGVELAPDSALYTVALESENATSALNSRTHVDRHGVLHVQKTGLAVGDTLTVTAVSTYINPETGEVNKYSSFTEITIAEPKQPDTFTVTYNVKGDNTHGIPADTSTPAPVTADEGANVQLAPKSATAWTTADGTEGGQDGTWTFAGWSTSDTGTPETTQITAIAADTPVYGVWTFTAS